MGSVEYLLLDIDTEEMFTAFDTDYQTLNYVSNPGQDNIVLLDVLE